MGFGVNTREFHAFTREFGVNTREFQTFSRKFGANTREFHSVKLISFFPASSGIH
ncbi:hypothetical protein RGV85_18085 [Peribacillus simplex]|nr:hypothetical protein [Peribacillus simplex]